MAGSWKHATTKTGELLSNERFAGMVENLGDAYETAEEMFGMIWWLAGALAGTGSARPSRQEKLAFINQAQANYRDGLEDGRVQPE